MVSNRESELQTMNQECAIHANTSKENSLAKTRDTDTGRDGPDSFSKSCKQRAVIGITACSYTNIRIAAKLRFITETATQWLGLN